MDSGSIDSLTSVWGNSSSDVFAISNQSVLHYNGAGWNISGTIYEAQDAWGSSGTDVFALGYGEDPGYYYYDGSYWTAITLPLGSRVGAIWGSSENSFFAVGGYGAILNYVRSTDDFPSMPSVIDPTDEAIIADGIAITLIASAFSDSNRDTHTQTQWKVVRYDTNEIVYYDDHDNLTQHRIPVGVLDAGLKYIWQVRYKDSSGDFSPWSEGAHFKIGNSVAENLPEIPSGKKPADFGMISIIHWPDNPSPSVVFNIDYDIRYYRIGIYNPLNSTYIEFDEGLEIQPGKAYWILAREGLNVNFNGVLVSKLNDIEVRLYYNSNTQDGWNMIAPPNEADYLWSEILVARANESGAVTFGPVSISSLANDNAYIDKRLWRWEDGSYYANTTLILSNQEISTFTCTYQGIKIVQITILYLY